MIPRWKEAREMFESLIDLEKSAQAARLGEVRNRDPELAEIVEDLLHTDRLASARESLDAGDESQATSPAPAPPQDRRAVGRFHLRHRIATGRTSSVWAGARNDGAFDQEVAIKLVDVEVMAQDLDCASAEALGHERRLLARVDSPNVVRLIDAGELDDGTEWLALEYLEGESLDAHCERRSLGLRARVELMVEACRGIEACHGRGVLHLDIAPNNVLITTGGAVKIIDLGAGLLKEATVGEPTIQSRGALTPAYAAPERFDRAAARASEPADVWSLGAMLYELLAGTLPIPVEHIPLAEVERRKLTEDALPLHRALSTQSKDLVARVAAKRGLAAKALGRALRAGGLDAVVNAATRREVPRRTSSVQELRADLERWLRGEPVRARRETLTQRATRFARHRPRLTLAGLAVGASIACGALALAFAAHHAQQNAAKIRRLERIEAERVKLARSAATTILKDLYLAIEPLAGTHKEVEKLVSAGIDIASSSDDEELTVWLGDAMIKGAVAEMVSHPWTRQGTRDRAAQCLEAQGIVNELRLREPGHYNAARVAWNAAKVRSVMLFELCDPSLSLSCVREAQAILESFTPGPGDLPARVDQRAQRAQFALLESTFEEAYGHWDGWLQCSRRAIDMLEDIVAASHSPRRFDRAQLHRTRVIVRYLTFFNEATAEELDQLGRTSLSAPLAAHLAEAEREAELAFGVLAEEPRRELLISKAMDSAVTLATWHTRLGQPEKGREWLLRAKEAVLAPGDHRTPAALASIATLDAATADEPPEIRENEIGEDVAAKLYVERARFAIGRGDTLEAARFAARATTLLDGNERRCEVHTSEQEARARIEGVLGHADLTEARTRSGAERVTYLKRAQRRLERALQIWEETSGDALYKKAMAFEGTQVATLLEACLTELDAEKR